MNLLETLVYNLPEPVQTRALVAGEESDDCCTVNCASIEVIEDYIIKLQGALNSIGEIVSSNSFYGKLEVCDSELHSLKKLIEEVTK